LSIISGASLADETGDGGFISLLRFCQMERMSSAETCSVGLQLMMSSPKLLSSSEGAFPKAALGLLFFLVLSADLDKNVVQE